MIVVIADDLSGAAELAGLAQSVGLAAEVQTALDLETSAEVVAIDTDTRSGSAELAGQRVREIVTRVLAKPPTWIYKKTDSALRGHVRAELSSLMTTLGCERTLLIPANPSRGRIIENSQFFINGTPLDQTLFASDPEYPATSARVADLLNREAGAVVQLIGRSAELPVSGIVVPDATSAADLECRAAAVERATLCAGAAEFFVALLGAREGRRPRPGNGPWLKSQGTFLLVCGSAAGWRQRQAECISRELPIFQIDPNALAAVERNESLAGLKSWAADTARRLTAARRGVIAVGDVPAYYARSPQLILTALATAAALVLGEADVDWLLLEGGATAAAVVRQIGWTRFVAAGHFAPDLAGFRVGDAAPGVVIKPGSYAWPERIWPHAQG